VHVGSPGLSSSSNSIASPARLCITASTASESIRLHSWGLVSSLKVTRQLDYPYRFPCSGPGAASPDLDPTRPDAEAVRAAKDRIDACGHARARTARLAAALMRTCRSPAAICLPTPHAGAWLIGLVSERSRIFVSRMARQNARFHIMDTGQ